jgi:hypothetical protein
MYKNLNKYAKLIKTDEKQEKSRWLSHCGCNLIFRPTGGCGCQGGCLTVAVAVSLYVPHGGRQDARLEPK